MAEVRTMEQAWIVPPRADSIVSRMDGANFRFYASPPGSRGTWSVFDVPESQTERVRKLGGLPYTPKEGL